MILVLSKKFERTFHLYLVSRKSSLGMRAVTGKKIDYRKGVGIFEAERHQRTFRVCSEWRLLSRFEMIMIMYTFFL